MGALINERALAKDDMKRAESRILGENATGAAAIDA